MFTSNPHFAGGMNNVSRVGSFFFYFLVFTLPFLLSFTEDEKVGYKTLFEKSYNVGDLILLSELKYEALDGESELPKNTESLKLIADFLSNHPTYTVELNVHTESRGDSEVNLDLSRRRAVALKNELVKKYGVDESKVVPLGFGETKPIYPDSYFKRLKDEGRMESMHRENRRVELRIKTV